MDSQSANAAREYQYSFKRNVFITLSLAAVWFGFLSIVFLYFITTYAGGPLKAWPFGRIDERTAQIFFYSISALMGIIAVTAVWLAWKAFPRKQRIVLTDSGISLPRTRFSAKEVFLAFGDISRIVQQELEEVEGQSKVVVLHLDSRQGRFSIWRQKMKGSDFDEICVILIKKIADRAR